MEILNVKKLFDILWQKKYIIAVITVVCALIGYFYNAKFVKPQYMSSSSIILSTDDDGEYVQSKSLSAKSGEISINEKLINTYAQIVTSEVVLDEVVNKLQLPVTSKQLAKNVSAKTDKNTTIIKTFVKADNPDLAVTISNEVNNAFLEKVNELYNIKTAKVLDPPKKNTNAINIKPEKYCIIGAFIGFCTICVVIFLKELLNDNIRNEDDVEKNVKITVLTQIPKFANDKERIVTLKDSGIENEAFRNLVANIKRFNIKSVILTSNTPIEGKSTISANLAVTYARGGKRTLLIDSDMRKGTQHEIFKIPNKTGLSTLVQNDSVDYKQYINENVIPNLDVLTSGSDNVNYSKLLYSNIIGEIVNLAKDEYDFIVVDGTPSRVVADDTVLYKAMDAALIIIKYNNTKAYDVRKIKNTIEQNEGKVIGAIVNKVPLEQLYGKRYGYYHYYDRYPTVINKKT